MGGSRGRGLAAGPPGGISVGRAILTSNHEMATPVTMHL